MNNFKTIIITGSSRGLGQAIAKKACKHKYFYYGISRWNDVDISKKESIDDYLINIINNDNDIEFPCALINNAGICIPETVLEMKQENLNNQIAVNLLGVINCTQTYAQLCIKNKKPGKIINIASTAGLGPRPSRSIYAATKAAIINFSLSMSRELKSYNIKTYCVCPGAFDSQLRRTIAPDDDFENMMKADEVAEFIISLIEDGKYLDSQILTIVR